MERRRLAPDLYALVAPGLEADGVLAAFTERTGGASDPPHATLNLGFRTGDRPDRVRRNRERVAGALDVPPFATARQVHGARAVRVGAARAGGGFSGPDGTLPAADALAVSRRGVPVAVLVADCLPIVLGRPGGPVAAVHAGWRGLAAGVLSRALALFGAAPPSAAIGPAIGPCHYEVGAEVAEAVDAGTGGLARTRRTGRSLYLDLPGTAARILRAAGVRRVETAEACTACQEERFFSHRRDGRTGRQGAVAMLL